MAAFPTTVATAADLLTAGNRDSSTLNGAISAGVTTLVVISGVFENYSVVTIDNERVKLGAQTISGTYTGCTRGFDNSTAASHATGAAVNANVVAAYHNTLASEIIAVETSLGQNLRLVQKVFNASGFAFTFTGATNLTGASPSTVVITPSPLGINSLSPTTHYLYISDGISSEAVLLTAVTVGASSTTVVFTPAVSHTAGQWTLGSATGGIQEAVKHALTVSGGGVVQIPSSVTQLRQSLFLGNIAVSVTLTGERLGCALQVTQDVPAIIARGVNQYWALRGFTIIYSSPVSVSSALDIANCSVGNPVIDNVGVSGGYYGALIVSCSGLSIRNSSFSSALYHGATLTGCSAINISNNTFGFNNVSVTSGTGLHIGNGCSAMQIIGNLANNNAYGFYFDGASSTLNVQGNTGINNTTADFNDVAGTRTSWLVEGNSGADTLIGAITAAGTVSLPATMSKTITVTGTTTINTINGAYGTGHEVVLFCPSGLTFSAAGNIKVALTTTYANQPVRARYNAADSKWYVV